MQKTLLTLSHRFSQVYPKSDNLASSASTFYVTSPARRPTNSSPIFAPISPLSPNPKASLLAGFTQII